MSALTDYTALNNSINQMIEVHVKTMAGDIIPLLIDSSTGIHGIQNALRNFDQKTYSTPFRIFPLEEYDANARFYNGMQFGVYVFPPPSLEDIQSYDQMDCFTFHVNDSTIYIYTVLTADHQLLFRYSTSFIPLDEAYMPNPDLRLGYYTTLFEATAKRGSVIHPQHSNVILSHIYEFVKTHRHPEVHITTLSYEPVACPCGAVVQRRSMAAHQKSQKHINQMK
jgi:hypothetical protein